MKKITYYVLLLTAFLAVGSSASATVIAVQSASELTTAFQDAQSGDVIQLQSDIALTSTLWLGTANMTDNSRALTLDLNGHTLSRTANVRMIDVTHGSLIVQSSSAGGRVDDYASVAQQSQLEDLMLVTGSYLKDINPRTDNSYYSHLVIAEGVTINAGQNAITIDRVGNADGHSIQYGTDVYNRGTGNAIGVAHGARVDIYGTIYAQKYGIKPNGLLVAPTTDGETLRTVSSDAQYVNYQVEATDTAYAPFIHVHPTAMIATNAIAAEATAVYASGYARWLIEGGCYGNMGLYIRSGCVSVHNAYIESSNPEHSSGTTQYHGVEAEGSAIVVNARSSVGGDISLYVSGATRVVSQAGYALEEIPTNAADTGSYIREIVLESGTFEAPEYPILVSEDTNIEIGDDVVISTVLAGSCGNDLTWSYSPMRRTLTISGNGPMTEISTDQQPWADFRTEIQTVSLSEGITTLSANAFSGCTNLYTINIPSTMTHIGDYAFYGCNVLSSVYWDAANYNQTKNSSPFDNAREHITGFTIGSNVTSIPHHLCFEFTALTSVVIHEDIQKIGNSAFEACRALQTLQMYEGVDSIGEYAFKNCTTLTTLTIPQSVGWVGNNAFESCGFREVTLNDNDQCLHTDVFKYCDSISELTIPSTWRNIPKEVFRDMRGLEQLNLPEGLETIGNIAFSGCKKLRSLSLPSTITFLDASFPYCDSLKTVYWNMPAYSHEHSFGPLYEVRDYVTTFVIDSQVTRLPHHLCFEFKKLTSIDIPASVSKIGNCAFEACYSLADMSIHEGLDSIGELAFKNCTTLTTLTIPQSVEWVGNNAFEACGFNEMTSLATTPPTITDNTFYNVDKSIPVSVPAGTRSRYRAATGWSDFTNYLALPCDAPLTDTVEVTICEGSAYEWRGMTLTETGIYTDSLLTEDGCDSINTLVLTVNPSYQTIINDTICDGEAYAWMGGWVTVENTYTRTLTAQNGCDSICTLNLTVVPRYVSETNRTICTGEPFVWRGRTLTQSGTYFDSLQTAYGCDSIYRLNLTVNTSYHFSDTMEVCAGTDFVWHGQSLTESGIYTDSLTTRQGCDSIYTLVLTVNPMYFFADEAQTCQGTGYLWRDRMLETAGTYYDSLLTVNGCDSIYQLTLRVNPTYASYDTAQICYGESYTWNGQLYTAQGDYDRTFETQHGCDSVAYLHLIENPIYFYSDTITLCENMPYEWHGRAITATGTYMDSLQSVFGCDSVYELVATVNPTFATDITVEICEGETYSWYDQVYNATGNYRTTLTALNGCDSVVTLHLTVNPTALIEENGAICQGGTYAWHRRVLTEAGIYYDTLQTIRGCDSVFRLTLTVYPSFFFEENASTCQGTPYSWHGRDLTEPGIYTDSLQTVYGCDSIYRLTLTVNPTYFYEESALTCQGAAYTWHGRDFYQAGTYYDSLMTIAGCDSVYRLTLRVNPTYTTEETVAVCQGEKFIWNGEEYTQTGDYRMTFAVGGCDSIAILHLTVHPTYFREETATTCSAPYTWHGRDLYRTGIYYDSLLTVHGCDSIIRLNLTVHETYSVTEEAAICDGESYTWHGRSFTRKGIYADTLHTVAGCDSICTLILTVNPKYLIEDIVSIREDKLPYRWQGENINQAGDYRKEYTSIYGCDSVHTLHLVVTALPIYTVNVQADHGHVNGTGTYPEGTRITLTAVPDEGFEFQMWSDGSETNPKEFVVMQDTTFRAHFYMPEVEQEVTVDSIETNSVTITWDTVAGAVLYELRIYKNGQLIVTYDVDPDNNIVGEHHIGPDRLIARKDSTGGTSETLQVSIGGLEPGQDYTYSLDALDDDRSYVGAQSGTFTTEEEPIDGLDTLFDKQRHPGARKVLRDGQLYIELPDGTRYSPEGARLDI